MTYQHNPCSIKHVESTQSEGQAIGQLKMFAFGAIILGLAYGVANRDHVQKLLVPGRAVCGQ